MKKIIPFKKDIKFDNNLYEVTSISLEHNLHKDNTSIIGNFIISGEYRATETSANTIPFSHSLPFTIDIDDKYDINNSIIDINDFYYEIIDSKYLSVNIEVKIDKIEEILIPELVNEPEEVVIEDNNIYNEDIKLRCIEDEEEKIEETPSIFNNIDSKDTFVNYRVYIVRDGDNLDSIMTDYQVTKEELEEYNDINNIKIGDKIIIPYVKNQ